MPHLADPLLPVPACLAFGADRISGLRCSCFSFASPTMSQHNSLKSKGAAGAKRSVLKRGERVKLLKSRGVWEEGRSPLGLPKTQPED